MIKFLIEKEFKQLLRNSFLPKLILVFPCMIMLLMPWAVNLEIKNIQLNIVDNDHSAISQRLVNKIAASTYFRLVEVPASYEEGLRNIEIGTADIVMEIPRHLERDWMNAKLQKMVTGYLHLLRLEEQQLLSVHLKNACFMQEFQPHIP